jgi:hypothetical protein
VFGGKEVGEDVFYFYLFLYYYFVFVVFLGDGFWDLGKEGKVFGGVLEVWEGEFICQYYDVEKVAVIYRRFSQIWLQAKI